VYVLNLVSGNSNDVMVSHRSGGGSDLNFNLHILRSGISVLFIALDGRNGRVAIEVVGCVSVK
jgi:hypothetical protein